MRKIEGVIYTPGSFFNFYLTCIFFNCYLFSYVTRRPERVVYRRSHLAYELPASYLRHSYGISFIHHIPVFKRHPVHSLIVINQCQYHFRKKASTVPVFDYSTCSIPQLHISTADIFNPCHYASWRLMSITNQPFIPLVPLRTPPAPNGPSYTAPRAVPLAG